MSDRAEPSKEEEKFWQEFEEKGVPEEELGAQTSNVEREASGRSDGENVSEGDKKTIYLPREVNLGLIQAALDRDDLNQSQIVREALKEWLEREGYL